jgi:hypothetical protein
MPKKIAAAVDLRYPDETPPPRRQALPPQEIAMTYDYQTNDNLGRRVEVTDHTFSSTRQTYFGDGSSTTSTGLNFFA